jgi:hypothetical protein
MNALRWILASATALVMIGFIALRIQPESVVFQPARKMSCSHPRFGRPFFAFFVVIDIADRQGVYFRRGQAGGFIGRRGDSWRPGKSKFLSFPERRESRCERRPRHPPGGGHQTLMGSREYAL